MNRYSSLASISILIALCAWRNLHSQPKIEVSAGDHPRIQTVVDVALTHVLKPGIYMVKNVNRGHTAIAYCTDNNRIQFILPDTLLPGEKALYKIKRSRQPSPVLFQKDKNDVVALLSNRPVLRYNTVTHTPPLGEPAYYERSGFIHPMFSPSGNVLTDDFPAGHRHQHGMMMAWVKTKFQGEELDFWNQQLSLANVRHTKVIASTGNQLKVQLEHYRRQHDKVILQETWTINIYPVKDNFIFDILSEQENVTHDTLFISKYHYGGVAFRGSKHWNPDDKTNFQQIWDVSTDSGYTLSNANGKHAAFVNVQGMLNGKRSGVAVFSFPENFRHPQSIRVHPTMPYWCFAPSADGAFSIAPNHKYIAKYRYYVYDGSASNVSIENLYNDLAHPVQVKLIY